MKDGVDEKCEREKWTKRLFDVQAGFAWREAFAQKLASYSYPDSEKRRVRIVDAGRVIFCNALYFDSEGESPDSMPVTVIKRLRNGQVLWERATLRDGRGRHVNGKCLMLAIRRELEKAICKLRHEDAKSPVPRTIEPPDRFEKSVLKQWLERYLSRTEGPMIVKILAHGTSFSNMLCDRESGGYQSPGVIWESKVPDGSKRKRKNFGPILEINVWPKYYKISHACCFVVKSRLLKSCYIGKAGEESCQCCDIPYPQFKSVGHFSPKAKISVVTDMKEHFLRQGADSTGWIKTQGNLVQGVFSHSNGLVYWDSFRKELNVVYCPTWQAVLECVDREFKNGLQKIKRQLLRMYAEKAKHLQRKTWQFDIEKAIQCRVVMIFNVDDWDLLDGLVTKFANQARIRKLKARDRNLHYGYRWRNWRLVNGEELAFANRSPSPPVSLENAVKHCQKGIDSFFKLMYEHFGQEVLSSLNFSIPFLAYSGVLSAMSEASPAMNLALGRSSMGLAILMKKTASYQLLYNSLPEIASGDKMSPRHEDMKSCEQIDMTSCYSYQAAVCSLPAGKPVVFHGMRWKRENETMKSQALNEMKVCRIDQSMPHNSGEFKTVYWICWQMERLANVSVRKVYSRYHGTGQWAVGKLSLDLLIVYSKRSGGAKKSLICYRAVNVHHAYSHTCPQPASVCKKPERYIRNLGERELESYSAKIDAFWHEYCKSVLLCNYETIYTCHPTEGNAMGKDYLTQPPLKRLTNFGLFKKRIVSLQDILGLFDSGEANAFQIFVVVEGGDSRIMPGQPGHVVTKKEGKTVLSQRTHGPTMMSAEYLRYLIKERDFKVEKVHHVITYLVTRGHQKSYRQVVDLRNNLATKTIGGAKSESVAFLKKVLNYSIGVLGASRTEQSIVTLHKKTFHPRSWTSTYHVEGLPSCQLSSFPNDADPVAIDCEGMFKVTRTYKGPSWRIGAHFPWHVCLLQHYRHAMIRAMQCMEMAFFNHTYRVVQIQTDSFVVLFSQFDKKDCSFSETHFKVFWEGGVHRQEKVPGYFNTVTRVTSEEKAYKILMPGVRTFSVVQEHDEGPRRNE